MEWQRRTGTKQINKKKGGHGRRKEEGILGASGIRSPPEVGSREKCRGEIRIHPGTLTRALGQPAVLQLGGSPSGAV